MKLILLVDDKRYGKKGAEINVNDGFANNFLIPHKIAIPATSTAKNEAHQLQESEQHKAQVLFQEAKELQEKIKQTSVVLKVKVGEQGKIFGSVSTKEIATELENKGIVVDKKKFELPNPIKTVGVHYVKIKLHPQVVANLSVQVLAQD